MFFSGLGFGLVICSVLFLFNTPNKTIPPKHEIEALARNYGMVYQDEILLFRETEFVEEEPSGQKSEAESKSHEIFKINIPRGSSSEKIAQILFDVGLIENKKDFETRVKDLGVANRLDAGDFRISSDLSIDEIIKILVVQERGK